MFMCKYHFIYLKISTHLQIRGHMEQDSRTKCKEDFANNGKATSAAYMAHPFLGELKLDLEIVD